MPDQDRRPSQFEMELVRLRDSLAAQRQALEHAGTEAAAMEQQLRDMQESLQDQRRRALEPNPLEELRGRRPE